MADYNNLYNPSFKKVLSVGEVKKVKTSYGNYSFNIETLNKGLNGLHKADLDIFGFGLKEINNKREEYLNKLKDGLK